MKSRPAAVREAFERCRDMDASLPERLAAFAAVARDFNPAFQGAVDRLVGRITEAAAFDETPNVGEPMPDFLLPDHAGQLFSLTDLRRKGPIAITFHRGHWCPYCRISIRAWARAHEEVARLGGEVVAVTPDLREFAAEFQAEAQAPFPILSDVDNGYAFSLGLMVWVGEEMLPLMRNAGNDLPKFQGNDSWTFPIPATFVVGPDGLVKARFLDPDYRRRAAIETVIEALASAR